MHPFATQERVTDNQLYILSTLIPMIVISILSLYLAPTNFDKLHLLQVSNLGLLFGVSAVSVLTDILKCWIGNPRPDFIDRCGPKEGTPLNVLFSISDQICTSPYGAKYLSDGMKSTPSGHSSMAFAGLVYLSLWLIGQFKLINRQNELDNKLVFLIIVCLPILLASYIGLSRTQDYRHHFFDVCFGSGLGIVFAVVSYFKYFRTLSDSKCNEPIDY
ncbi:hypothetical protein KGF56_001412 [Candida oxycetoniae]|uniref:Phosphatidic acid phosphatase type 2/haloperoxidase domain-containing protein n=1 Tax=Candida oxycetoniae TaxID=497107 RepID=A0AAI9T0K0_9ASCO|nr:uncharacterized protein KGF56_001412 [Candida oxycetoniae]KAI3405805.2 hypothetical protein KGF56_001412 [Candida oxycetoniae]